MENIKKQLECTHPILYKCDNNFAYHYCIGDKEKMSENLKLCNFVPTYDEWCLYCWDKVKEKKKCSRCKSVFFCNETCQRKAWKIHKKHCGRDLFQNCATCGIPFIFDKNWIKCEKCPVKFCSTKCKDQLYESHKMVDCDYFSKTFNNLETKT